MVYEIIQRQTPESKCVLQYITSYLCRCGKVCSSLPWRFEDPTWTLFHRLHKTFSMLKVLNI